MAKLELKGQGTDDETAVLELSLQELWALGAVGNVVAKILQAQGGAEVLVSKGLFGSLEEVEHAKALMPQIAAAVLIGMATDAFGDAGTTLN